MVKLTTGKLMELDRRLHELGIPTHVYYHHQANTVAWSRDQYGGEYFLVIPVNNPEWDPGKVRSETLEAL